MTDLTVDSTAREMLAALSSREISCSELMDLHLARISERNPELNAIVSLDEERARDGASEADRTPYDERGPLHGLPWAFKDTHDVAGWLTTYGSPLLRRQRPRPRRAGRRADPAGGGGADREDERAGVRGRQPHVQHDLRHDAATRSTRRAARAGPAGERRARWPPGMVPLAEGSDMGGSLRNPASFCGVYGLRPSRGRVPAWPSENQWEALGISGPMARNVDDLALLLSVLAGPDPRVPLALGDPGATFAPPVMGSLQGLRVAVSTDLGGLIEVDAEVAAVVEATADAPGRGRRAGSRPRSRTSPSARTPSARCARGRSRPASGTSSPSTPTSSSRRSPTTSAPARGWPAPTSPAPTSSSRRSARPRACSSSRYDVLLLPTSQVPPFPADQEYPADINGQPMATYLDWMRSAYLVTVTGCPAISVPAGRTGDGLPVGVQLVATHGADRRLLEVAAAVEALGLA